MGRFSSFASLLAAARVPGQNSAMFGLSFGEIGLVTFIVVAILSARLWPKLGEWVVRRVARKDG
jgi:hypothetical protein